MPAATISKARHHRNDYHNPAYTRHLDVPSRIDTTAPALPLDLLRQPQTESARRPRVLWLAIALYWHRWYDGLSAGLSTDPSALYSEHKQRGHQFDCPRCQLRIVLCMG
jgi:hypothetical protein